MPEAHKSAQWVAKLAMVGMVFALVVLGLAVALTVAGAIVEAQQGGKPMVVAICAVGVLAELALAIGVVVAYGLILGRLAADHATKGLDGKIGRVEAVLAASRDLLGRLADLAQMSDQAKALIHHEQEIEAIQEVIHTCLLKQEYGHAEQLLSRMSKNLGAHAEVERLRAAIVASKQATAEEKVSAAVERVEKIIQHGNWGRAAREAQRLIEAFPDSERVAKLPKEIGVARNQHKMGLLRQYDQAVKRNDVDRSIELLKRLDHYLTPQEAAALEESVRGVFRAKLHNLGVQFAIAVTDEQWGVAVRAGEEIIRDFPNSRMAMEVHQKLGALRQRAS